MAGYDLGRFNDRSFLVSDLPYLITPHTVSGGTVSEPRVPFFQKREEAIVQTDLSQVLAFMEAGRSDSDACRTGEGMARTEFSTGGCCFTPKSQGQGIGGRLHDCLLAQLPYEKAVLSTMRAQTGAYWMYRKRSWQVLVENMRFPGVGRLYQVMGLDLARSQDRNTVFQGCNRADISG